MNKKVTVHVPATSANLGPGFDVLGIALHLYNDVIFSADPKSFSSSRHTPELLIDIEGEGVRHPCRVPLQTLLFVRPLRFSNNLINGRRNCM